jgi:hypothetical protein
MTAKNACKACALGMGGQAGAMHNETGHRPEVCKKSSQAMVADMQQGLRPEFFQRFSIAQLQTLTPRELEWCGRLAQRRPSTPGIDWKLMGRQPRAYWKGFVARRTFSTWTKIYVNPRNSRS